MNMNTIDHLDDSLKSYFNGGSPERNKRIQKIRNYDEAHSNDDGGEKAKEPIATSEKPDAKKDQAKEKRILGMKPKTAFWVGFLGLVTVGGIVYYFYNKKQVA